MRTTELQLNDRVTVCEANHRLAQDRVEEVKGLLMNVNASIKQITQSEPGALERWVEKVMPDWIRRNILVAALLTWRSPANRRHLLNYLLLELKKETALAIASEKKAEKDLSQARADLEMHQRKQAMMPRDS